jgi:hypothetical protein
MGNLIEVHQEDAGSIDVCFEDRDGDVWEKQTAALLAAGHHSLAAASAIQ